MMMLHPGEREEEECDSGLEEKCDFGLKEKCDLECSTFFGCTSCWQVLVLMICAESSLFPLQPLTVVGLYWHLRMRPGGRSVMMQR
jgi:hypothetical protein